MERQAGTKKTFGMVVNCLAVRQDTETRAAGLLFMLVAGQ